MCNPNDELCNQPTVEGGKCQKKKNKHRETCEIGLHQESYRRSLIKDKDQQQLIASLKSQLVEYEKNRNSLISHLQQHEIREKESSGRIVKLNQDLWDARSKLDDKTEAYGELRSEYNLMRQSYDELKHQMQQQEIREKESSERIVKLNQDLSNARSKLNDKTEAYGELRSEYNLMRDVNVSLENDVQTLVAKLRESELSTAQILATGQCEASRASDRLAERNQELSDTRSKLDDKSQAYTELRIEHNLLRVAKANLDNDVKSLAGKLSEAEKSINNMRTEAQVEQSQFVALNQELSSARAQLSNKIKAYDEMQMEQSLIRVRHSRLENDVVDMKVTELSNARMLAAAQDEASRSIEKLANLNQELSNEKRVSSDLRASNERLKGSLERSETEVTETKKQMTEAHQKCATLNQLNSQLEQGVEALTSELNTLQKSNRTLQADITSLEVEMQTRCDELITLHRDLTASESTNQSNKIQLEAETTSHRSSIEQLNQQIEKLKQSLDNATNSQSELVSQNDVLKSSLDNQKQIVALLNDDKTRHEEMFLMKCAEVDDLKQKRDVLEQEHEE